MLDFVRPEQSKTLVSLAQAVWPLYAKLRCHGMRLEISREVLDAFNATRGSAAIICANHSAEEDPDVLFGLSRMVNERFYFLTAREIFGDSRSLKCKWLQKLGCFSVERGLADMNSFKAVQNLLQAHSKIVIFPEGEISRHNDALMDLENGPEHMALSALEEIQSGDANATVFIVPLALKYRYDQRAKPDLENHLAKVERLLGRQARPGESIRTRLRKSFDILLARLEKQFDWQSDKSSRLGERWRLLRESIVQSCEEFVGVNLPETTPQLRRIHILKILSRRKNYHEHKGILSPNLLNSAEREVDRHCRHNLILATILTGVGEHSFDHRLSQEESAELIGILEQVLYRRNTVLRPNIVSVGVGNLIDARQFSAVHSASKHEAISALKSQLRNEILTTLHKLEARSNEPTANASLARQ